MPMDFKTLSALATLLPQEPGSFLRFATAEQRAEYFDSINAFHQLVYATTAAYTIIGWETLLLAPAELRTIRLLIAGRFLPARLAVMVVRWSCIAAMITCGILFWGAPANCRLTSQIVYAWYIPLWAAAASVSIMRLNILFQGNRVALSAYGAIYCVTIAAWINLIRGLDTHILPIPFRLPKMGICIPARIPTVGGPLAWGASCLFDFAVLSGTVLQLHRLSSSKAGQSQLARTRRWLWTSNVFYFSISAFLNLACMITEIAVRDPILSHMPTTIAFALHTVIASRLVLSAKGWSGGADLDDGKHLVNTFNRDKRQTRSVLGGPIRFTVDETIVTSIVRDEDGAVQAMTRDRPTSKRSKKSAGGGIKGGQETASSSIRARARAYASSSPITPLPSYRSMSEGEKSMDDARGPALSGLVLTTSKPTSLHPSYSDLGAASDLERDGGDPLHSDEEAERLVDDLASYGFIEGRPRPKAPSKLQRPHSYELEDRKSMVYKRGSAPQPQSPTGIVSDAGVAAPSPAGAPGPSFPLQYHTHTLNLSTPGSSKAPSSAEVSNVSPSSHPYAGSSLFRRSDDSVDAKPSQTSST